MYPMVEGSFPVVVSAFKSGELAFSELEFFSVGATRVDGQLQVYDFPSGIPVVSRLGDIMQNVSSLVLTHLGGTHGILKHLTYSPPTTNTWF